MQTYIQTHGNSWALMGTNATKSAQGKPAKKWTKGEPKSEPIREPKSGCAALQAGDLVPGDAQAPAQQAAVDSPSTAHGGALTLLTRVHFSDT